MTLKVVQIIARLNVGGPAPHAILLTRGLNPAQFQSTLVTGTVNPGEGDMGPLAEEQGVRPIVIRELRRDPRPLDDLRVLAKICRIIFARRPDIIHTHTAKAGAVGRIAGFLYNMYCRLTGRPRSAICHTFHGHLFHGYFSRWASLVLILGERFLARVTDRIITVSEEMRHELTRVYRICPEQKCTVVPLGLNFGWTRDLPAYRGVFKEEAGVARDCLAIGIVGRLTAIKNHELFLRAAQACRVSHARFLVIGDGERRLALKEFADHLGLNGRVVFTGWQHNLAKVYGNLDIASLTSHNEGTPASLIEAMAAGVPVVATKVGGVADLMVGKATRTADGLEVFANGILVPPERPELLGAAWEFLAVRPEVRSAMGLAGQSFAQERFSVDRLVAEIEQLYHDLLENIDRHRLPSG